MVVDERARADMVSLLCIGMLERINGVRVPIKNQRISTSHYRALRKKLDPRRLARRYHSVRNKIQRVGNERQRFEPKLCCFIDRVGKLSYLSIKTLLTHLSEHDPKFVATFRRADTDSARDESESLEDNIWSLRDIRRGVLWFLGWNSKSLFELSRLFDLIRNIGWVWLHSCFMLSK